MAKATRKTGSDQITTLQELSQNAAAWLLGMAPRTLRDHPEIPRTPSGRYNARDLLQWSMGRVDRPEIDDEDYELLLLIGEVLGRGLESDLSVIGVVDTLETLRAKYGDGALVAFIEIWLANWKDYADSFRSELRPLSEGELLDIVKKQREEHAKEVARARLHIAVLCETCKKLRRGRRWIEASPPEDYVVIYGICPKCTEAAG